MTRLPSPLQAGRAAPPQYRCRQRRRSPSAAHDWPILARVAPTRWSGVGIPVLGFLGVLAVVLLLPRDVPLDCLPGKSCGSLLTGTRHSPYPALLHYVLPAAVGAVAIALLFASRHLPRGARAALWVA